MKTLAAVGILCALLQDKSAVSISPDQPTDAAWPILGRANRPNGTVVKLCAVRVEHRWDPEAGRFRESLSPESRLLRSAEIEGRAFKANLRPGAPGLYDVAVNEGEQRLHADRLLLGSCPALFASTKKSVAKLIEIADRAMSNLDEIQRILAGKQPGTARAREAFITRVHGDEQLLVELAAKTDLTASAFLLGDVCSHIRNAQVWELPPSKAGEELNDGQGGTRDIFLDPKLTFKSMHATIESVKTVISRELSLSAATILGGAFARAEEKPDRLLSKAKDAASEALKVLQAAPVEDKEARAAIEAGERADAGDLAEVRKGLQAIVAKYLAQP